MARISATLLDQLSEFLICEIGAKAIDGITYTMLLKDNKKDAEIIKRYNQIKQEVLKCGYSNDEIFRIYKVNNGYIFDLDLSVAKQITFELSKAVASQNNNSTPIGDLIGNSPEKRRSRDMSSLARYIKETFEGGEREIEVALFNKNSTDKIMVSGLDKDKNKIVVNYRAYAIRHWDIEELNTKYLIPAGIKVERIQPCDILPHKTGVSFWFKLSEC